MANYSNLWKSGENKTAELLSKIGYDTVVVPQGHELQFKDIDVVATSKKTGKKYTISVKTQAIANRTGNFSFEEYAITKDGKQDDGNFRYSEADYMAIAVPDTDTNTIDVYLFKAKTLKNYIYSQNNLIRKTLAFGGRSSNTSVKYTDFINIIIPIGELMPMAKLVKKLQLA
jgi:hypothetical protein